MALQIGDTAPDFEAETTEGQIRFHEWIGDTWGVLFSHPEGLHARSAPPSSATWRKLKPEFDKRNVKIIGLVGRSGGQPQQLGTATSRRRRASRRTIR